MLIDAMAVATHALESDAVLPAVVFEHILGFIGLHLFMTLPPW